MMKKALEKQCGFTNVYNCENPTRIKQALPNIAQVSTPNTMSLFPTMELIRDIFSNNPLILDAREPEEIAADANAIEGNITFVIFSLSFYHLSLLLVFFKVISIFLGRATVNMQPD
jgi:hypothetical protein